VSELDKLIELQRVDKELMRIEELKGDLPEKVRETRQALRKHEAQLEQDKARLEEIKKEERKHESTIEDENAKIEEKQDQLYLVTTNKEYDALTSEIEQFKKSVDDSEMKLVELSDEKDELEEAISMEKSQVEELAENLEAQESDLEKTIEKTEKEQENLEQEREEIVKDIPRSKLSRYDRIRNARNGLAVVPVVRGSCGGCLQRIPPQNLVEIRTRDRMVPCEICGRFLYWPNEEESSDE